MSFGDNLRAIRKEHGVSQEELAELLDVSRQAVSKWEQGDGYPEMEKVLQLSRTLQISLDALMGEEPYERGSVKAASGRILIRSSDGKSVVNCYKVASTPQFKAKKDEPKCALFGVDSATFFDENRTLLGWYAEEEDLRREVAEIMAALAAGKPSYELKYAAKVRASMFSVKLEQA